MNVKFYNGQVPVYKLRKGTLVRYDNDYFHIEHVYNTRDSRIQLHLVGAFEPVEVAPEFVEWLEPM